MLQRLAFTLVTNRRRVILGWVAFVALAVVVGGSTVDRLVTIPEGDQSTESAQVEAILEDLGATSPDVVALYDGIDPTDPAFAQEVQETDARLSTRRGVVQVLHTYNAGPLFTSTDGEATLVGVVLDASLDEDAYDALVDVVEDDLREVGAARTLIGGDAVLDRESVEQTESDLQQAELLTLPITLVLAVVIFGGLVAASLPLMVALVAIPGALLTLWTLTLVTDVQIFALSAATMLGLGLAIDYALLIVNRFREERAAGLSVDDAVRRTVTTAGVTVIYSGLTVAVALGGFLMLSGNVFPSIGMGSIGVVLIAMASAVTLLPAVLSRVGHRIKPAAGGPNSGRVFHRISTVVQRRPAIVAGLVTVALLTRASPFLGARLQIPGAEALPDSLETRQLLDEREARFETGGEDPVTVVATTTGPVEAYLDEVAAIDGVLGSQVRFVTGDVTVIDVLPEGPAQGATAEAVVQELRDLEPTFDTAVGGPAADLIDQRDSLYSRIPWALAFVAGATLLLLFLMTGSVVMPFKAMFMNLLSLTATFGVLVWGFQDGNLSGVLGFDEIGYVGLWTPFLVFFIAFGLSMDYEVFLLARIKEIHDETGDNDEAVSLGLQRTGRVITSAALLISIVFAAFATGESVDMKQLGVGLALAIIIDATIVRMFLVPASMKLMGEWNWWAPAPLRRFHDRFGLHEPPSGAGEFETIADLPWDDSGEREPAGIG